jgi:iron complex transport system ATP-binding protein
MSGPLLEMVDVAYDYGDRVALAGVSLELELGRFVGLFGPNGSGKSTLLRLAAGLLHPRAGSVRLAGCDLPRLGRAEVARRVAVVPQDGLLPPAFTGWEIALMGRTPHLGWFAAEGPRDEAIAWRALELAGADAFAERRAGELSGGERQRLLLARALAQEPDALLLDEPTTHLDLAHQVALLDLIGSLARAGELAVLAVFHDLNLAAAYCDELICLSGGRVQARGRPDAVLTPDLIHMVFGLELLVFPHPQSGRPAILPPAASPAPVSIDARRIP